MESFRLKNIGGGLVGRGLTLLAISVLVISMTQITSGEANDKRENGVKCSDGRIAVLNTIYQGKIKEDLKGSRATIEQYRVIFDKTCKNGCTYWKQFCELVCGPEAPDAVAAEHCDIENGPGPGPKTTTAKPASPAKSNSGAVHGNGLIVLGVLATLFSTLVGIF